ncbi:PKD domain-containing protein [[Eubacterium] cellulosolvens]
MNRSLNLLLNLLIIGILFLTSIASIIVLSSPVEVAPEVRLEKTPSDFNGRNVFYLCNGVLTSPDPYFKGHPETCDGWDPELNKLELLNGYSVYFTYPKKYERKARLIYDQHFNGNPFIHLTLNSYNRKDKMINVEFGIDTDNDNEFELSCIFPPYKTIGDTAGGVMEEEVYEAYGTWQSAEPPAYVEGWLKLKITMTSPNGDPCLLYCGFGGKVSWCALPYFNDVLPPVAKINTESLGFEKRIDAGETITFDGSGSYSPYDDLNGNDRIDDGYPVGELDMGELDRLRYQWHWGDGTCTDSDYGNRVFYHEYTNDKFPLKCEYEIFEVILIVTDPDGRMDSDKIDLKVYRGNNSPRIKSFKINDEELCLRCPEYAKLVLHPGIQTYFSVEARDADGDALTYHWDMDGDGEFDIEGTEAQAAKFYYKFQEPDYQPGWHSIELVVSDGTLAMNDSFMGGILFVRNCAPVAIIRVQRKGESTNYYHNITTGVNDPLIFDSSLSYDRDRLPGFDDDHDYKPDYSLRYRWIFNSRYPSMTSGWLTQTSYEFQFTDPGDYKYFVTLDVDDGLNWTTSEPFLVRINVKPVAKLSIEPESYNSHGNLYIDRPIYFNGSLSYDPNGDKIVDYFWDFCDGSLSRALRPMHTYTSPGEYLVTLKVFDGVYWSALDSIKIEIPKPINIKCISYEVYPLEVYTYDHVYFDATELFVKESIENELRFRWYFGDENSSTEVSTTHVYSTAGKYPISIELSDANGMKTTWSRVIVHVLNRKPVAHIREIRNVYQGEAVYLSAEDSFDVDGKIIKYHWHFGDGSTESWMYNSRVEHIWHHAGTFTITLIVEDDYGNTNDTVMQVEVLSNNADENVEDHSTLLRIVFVIMLVIIIIIVWTVFKFRK